MLNSMTSTSRSHRFFWANLQDHVRLDGDVSGSNMRLDADVLLPNLELDMDMP
jgi:hypothetical protein